MRLWSQRVAALVAVGLLVIVLPGLLAGTPHHAGASPEGEEHEPVVMHGSYGCGIERWAVKTGTDADAHKVNLRHIVTTNILSLRRLNPPASLPSASRVAPVEDTVYMVPAILLRFKEENDSDYHLVLADTGGRTMIAEIPYPSCVGATSPFRASISNARRAFDAHYTVNTEWHRVHVPAKVTGVAFFDFKHGQSGVAPNAIELHPVLAIAFGSGTATTVPPPPASSGNHHQKSSSSTGIFTVRAWVAPSTVPYGSYPTLYASARRGASCSASVRYSTGYPPRSFAGESETVGSSGKVSWSWHMETSGTGGTATVTCSLNGRSKTVSTSFTVAR